MLVLAILQDASAGWVVWALPAPYHPGVSARIIDGKSVSEARRAALAERVRALEARAITPCLAAVSAHADHGWMVYLRNQAQACAAVGIRHRQVPLPAGAGPDELFETIEGLNLDPAVHGILLQSPLALPGHEGTADLQAQAQLSPDKDVEGVNPANLGLLLGAQPVLAPCTALSAVALAEAGLRAIGRPSLQGVEACVVGASTIVGKPIAQLLLAAGATVTVCHIHTRDLASHTRQAQLVVVAVGRAGLIRPEHIAPGAVVVDVGINRSQGADGRTRTVGDVDPAVAEVAGALTPVPGGVGELTTTVLLESTVTACERLASAPPGVDPGQIQRLLGTAELLPRAAAERIATMLARHLVGLPGQRPLRSPLERRLRQGVLLLDGALGTELIERRVDRTRIAEATLEHPDLVLAVHRAYVEAGAEALTANSFGANRLRQGREEAVRLAGAAVRLARQAALAASGRTVFVLGSIGPLGRVVGAEISAAEATAAAAEVALAMADQGADGLILETMASTAAAQAALAGCRQVTSLPVIACRSIERDDPVELAEFARAMEEGGAAAVGINCAAGPRALEAVIARLASLTRLPVLARPNAGFPVREDGQLHYHLRPEYLVERMRAYLAHGARLIGGCCGVGPAHIHALAQALRTLPAPATPVPPPVPAAVPATPLPAPPAHPLLAQARAGGFPILAMLAGRLGPGATLAAGERLARAGVDAIGLLGGWPGAARGARLAAQVRHLQDGVHRPGVLELLPATLTLPQAQEVALTGHLLGLSLVLVDAGTIAAGPGGEGEADPLAVVRLLQRLNRGRDLAGSRLDAPTAFTVGVRLRARAIADAPAAVAAGADFLALPPIYEPDRFKAALALVRDLGLPVFAESLLLPDAATAEELDNELPELSVPERLKQRLRTDTQEDVRGVLRFAQAYRQALGGLILMAADERTEALEAVARAVRAPSAARPV